MKSIAAQLRELASGMAILPAEHQKRMLNRDQSPLIPSPAREQEPISDFPVFPHARALPTPLLSAPSPRPLHRNFKEVKRDENVFPALINLVKTFDCSCHPYKLYYQH